MIDLHIHSTASDGVYTPREIIKKAVNEGVRAVSITDHDTVKGVKQVLDADGVEVISGVEISTRHENEQPHILGYGIQVNDEDLLNKLEYLRKEREARADKIIKKLHKLGIELSKQDIVYENSIGRPNIARALVKKGYVTTVSEAFTKYLGEGKSAFVPKTLYSFKQSVSIIEEADGVPILAHPGELESKNLNYWLNQSLEYGIKGVEVYHPSNDKKVRKELLQFAEEEDLLITGGSDCHGKPPKEELFIEDIPYELYKDLS